MLFIWVHKIYEIKSAYTVGIKVSEIQLLTSVERGGNSLVCSEERILKPISTLKQVTQKELKNT